MAYNEPAFPSGESYVTTDFAGNQTTHRKGPLYQGITKREYFAGQALIGLLSHEKFDYSPLCESSIPNAVYDAIKIAEAMIKALQE